tara:strand:+ start:322 stop:501 length:180 start_codon:yes stop_codon:yes gene_type:complete
MTEPVEEARVSDDPCVGELFGVTLAAPLRNKISVAPGLETRKSTWVPWSFTSAEGEETV